MRHLLSFSVYQGLSELGSDPNSALASAGCDGLELLTGYSQIPESYRSLAPAVHLPYATDWLAAWDDRPYGFSEQDSPFYMYGRTREEVVGNIRAAIGYAADLHPLYGVMHAGNADVDEIFKRRYTRDSAYVIDAFAEMMNEVMSGFPGGEPPFRILFENLWWPGFRLLDDSDLRRLAGRTEFENWGVCLDTGHMMNCLPDIRTQRDGIEALQRIFDSYSRDTVDRIETVHLHWSASYDYRTTFEERGLGDDLQGYMRDAYGHIGRIDMHMPFTDPDCALLIQTLEPSTVTHEMPGSVSTPLEDFRTQRALLP